MRKTIINALTGNVHRKVLKENIRDWKKEIQKLKKLHDLSQIFMGRIKELEEKIKKAEADLKKG
ncbi:MAG: hypothetical protein ACR2QC_00685 [Gammaproteobacteria bacterium]